MARTKIEDGAAETIETAVGKGAEKVQETFEKASKGLEKMAAFHKDTIQALIASAGAASKGAEAIQSEIASFAKTAAENMAAQSKAMMGVKSVQAAFELQSTYAKSSFETYLAEMTKVSAMWVGATKEAMEPIQGRAKAMMSMLNAA